MDIEKLKQIARNISGERQLNDFITIGGVGAALETVNGNVYTGISIDTACSMGFCAEHSAIAEMLKQGEYKIKAMVAVNSNGDAVPPCGRCRELISQLSSSNLQTIIEVKNGIQVPLSELLPYDWKATTGHAW
ncbi:cytidine deaminase [Niabella sp.]|uniref:cytidine deaminase family protein n=1 Tax=Niabella sp. TaxID=1962976 RepID=UPI00261D1755|nr:cytidine deaminase [Niabella sp.]